MFFPKPQPFPSLWYINCLFIPIVYLYQLCFYTKKKLNQNNSSFKIKLLVAEFSFSLSSKFIEEKQTFVVLVPQIRKNEVIVLT